MYVGVCDRLAGWFNSRGWRLFLGKWPGLLLAPLAPLLPSSEVKGLLTAPLFSLFACVKEFRERAFRAMDCHVGMCVERGGLKSHIISSFPQFFLIDLLPRVMSSWNQSVILWNPLAHSPKYQKNVYVLTNVPQWAVHNVTPISCGGVSLWFAPTPQGRIHTLHTTSPHSVTHTQLHQVQD